MKKYISRAVSVLLACVTLVLFANISNGNINFSPKGPDAVTSASVKKQASTASIEGVSGNFVVLINKNNSPRGTKEFFEGRQPCPQGLECSVAKSDKKVDGLLKSLAIAASPKDDALIMLSKAEYGDFDVMILSKKLADTYTAKSLYDKDYVDVVEIKGE